MQLNYLRLQVGCVCPYVDLVQTTLRPCSVLQHRRRVSAVHLAGSCIMTCAQLKLYATRRRQHSSNVLINALLTTAVLPLSGMIRRVVTTDAGYMTAIVHVVGGLVSHSLKSSDVVIQHQVRDVTTHYIE